MSSSIASHCSISVTDTESRIQHLTIDPSTQDQPAPSPELASNRRNQTCCFCWCCSCSRLPTKRPDDYPSKDVRLTNLKKQDETITTMPPLEEVNQWRESFDRVMRSCTGRQVFREFLQSEYSEENMLFWLACEDFRKQVDDRVIEERARAIYEDYISILSPKEVSLDSRVRELINGCIENPSVGIFDEAQLQIYTLMQRDSYPRFLNSQIYKRLLRQ